MASLPVPVSPDTNTGCIVLDILTASCFICNIFSSTVTNLFNHSSPGVYVERRVHTVFFRPHISDAIPQTGHLSSTTSSTTPLTTSSTTTLTTLWLHELHHSSSEIGRAHV